MKKKTSYDDILSKTSEKDYIPKNGDLEEGSEGEDVYRLHQYLSKFGYFELENISNLNSEHLKDTLSPIPNNKNIFDKNTTNALKKFQKLNGLPETGKLDTLTLSLMNKPRCGFSDTLSFVIQGNWWAKHNLTYGFQNFTPDLSQAQVRNAISQAFNLWSTVTPLTFSEIPFSNNPDIKIKFSSGDHGDGSQNSFDGPGGVLAHAFFPPPNGGDIAGDAHFDEAEKWYFDQSSSGVDLVTIAAHEFGHSLGLGHSSISGALMYAYYSGPKRKLHNDDIAGIQTIYGSKKTVPLHRYWNAGNGDHFYTTNWSELGAGSKGYKYEGIQCYVHLAQITGSVPLHRYWNAGNGDHFYTTNWSELGAGSKGYKYEGIQCYIFVQPENKLIEYNDISKLLANGIPYLENEYDTVANKSNINLSDTFTSVQFDGFESTGFQEEIPFIPLQGNEK